jgi:DNA polymerase-1
MIDAFHAGGDFHSRTAMDMFDYVQEKVDSGECLLEWDYLKVTSEPMLKDMFASERRKAKTLNFSIAYGNDSSRSESRLGNYYERSRKHA